MEKIFGLIVFLSAATMILVQQPVGERTMGPEEAYRLARGENINSCSIDW